MIEKTDHQVVISDARDMSALEDESVELVVTSPPYPMIEMWDDSFSSQNPEVREALKRGDPSTAFELMHQVLDEVWRECHRVLCEGGMACINIGDATRTINARFQLFSNHSRIISSMLDVGFLNLPNIIWRKQTNAPNKFMGSGMYPPGAYVTLEHEFILVFRKGDKREFSAAAKTNRRESAYFWEERNQWFSDMWDMKGTGQYLGSNGTRSRSGAFPLEVPYRLINMFSVKGDRVLDPFVGLGTTMLAALGSGRGSIGYERDPSLSPILFDALLEDSNLTLLNNIIRRRILNHEKFIAERMKLKGGDTVKYVNEALGFPVMTRQERDLLFQFVASVREIKEGYYEATYIKGAASDYQGEGSLFSHA